MKICLINNLYKPYNRGGAERIVEIIADGLQAVGHEVFIITTKPITQKHKNTKTRKHKIYYLNSLYYNLNKIPKFLRIFWHFIDMFDIGSYLKIKSILKKAKPDVVMTHNLKGIGYLIPKAIKNLNIRHIHTLHDIQLLHPSGLMIYGRENKINSQLAKIYARICKWLFSSPDIVISPSNWLMAVHTDRKFFKNSLPMILPNPIARLSRADNPADKKSDIFKFLYVGQIEEHKGILFLVKTFQKLNDNFKKNTCQLTILGNGTKIKEAKKLASGNKYIKFKEWAGHKEATKNMQNSNCLIVPSLCYENSPTVIYEATAVGLPVIAARIGGLPEIAHKINGILFTPANKNNLIKKLKWIVANHQKIKATASNNKIIIEKLSSKNYISHLVKIIKIENKF